MSGPEQAIVPMEVIAGSILLLRGQRVILDADLARLYGVSTKRLNEQVRRNADRFPEDFVFRLTPEEYANLKSQNATSSGHGGRRKLPVAFSEHGALMAATVLNSPRAVDVSVYVVRAFVRMRTVLGLHEEIAQRLRDIEARLDNHDEEIAVLIQALGQLLASPDTSERRIGFRIDDLCGAEKGK